MVYTLNRHGRVGEITTIRQDENIIILSFRLYVYLAITVRMIVSLFIYFINVVLNIY